MTLRYIKVHAFNGVPNSSKFQESLGTNFGLRVYSWTQEFMVQQYRWKMLVCLSVGPMYSDYFPRSLLVTYYRHPKQRLISVFLLQLYSDYCITFAAYTHTHTHRSYIVTIIVHYLLLTTDIPNKYWIQLPVSPIDPRHNYVTERVYRGAFWVEGDDLTDSRRKETQFPEKCLM